MLLFSEWPENHLLTLEQLRLKCITLLSLCLMLRLWDIAPKAVNMKAGKVSNVQFMMDRVQFLDDGSASVYLHGVRNDYHSDGFRVFLIPRSMSKVCPVLVLQELISRTGRINPAVDRLVFTPLNYPFSSLAAGASILNKAI